MTWLFDSGHAVDIVLAVILLEFIWLVWRSNWHPTDAALRLAPGAMILIALRAALTNAAWPLIALPLFLSFPLHLVDVKRSGRRTGPDRLTDY